MRIEGTMANSTRMLKNDPTLGLDFTLSFNYLLMKKRVID